MNPNKPSIIIPAYNEESQLGSVIKKALPYGNVIVVDDGSVDSTPKIAKENGAHLLQHLINMGKGAALKTGCEYAIKKNSTTLIAMDADAQHDPADIPRFLEKLKESDIVFGHRSFSDTMPSILRFGNKAINKITRWLFGVSLHDTQCGFRAFTKKTYQQIRWEASNYSMESEMITNVGLKKLKYSQIPIKTIYTDRYKGTTVIDGIKIVLNMIWWRMTR